MTTKKPPRVAKPTIPHNNMIVLASDVNYHVVRYVRACTIKSVAHPGRPLHKTKAGDALSMAIKQTKALLYALAAEIPSLK